MISVLLISTCEEKLHELEFVKPIEDILIKEKIKFFTKCYKEISFKDLERCSKVIICGTSLADFDYINNLNKFEWIKSFEKPILGICAGMQILYILFKGKENFNNLKNQKDIGFRKVFSNKDFFGLKKEFDAYFLHSIGVKKNIFFNIIGSTSTGISIVKHNEKPFYGVLFHPEVRNKNLILEFVKNG